jgi:hypothetical protein
MQALQKYLETVSTDKALRELYSASLSAFTREQDLPFRTLVVLLLNMLKRSVSVEIRRFFHHIKKASCTKAAFCMQRKKLKAEFFQSWNDVLIRSFHQEYGKNAARWKGFTLCAIDGSVFNLPDTPELRELYGCASSEKGTHGAVARSAILYDVLNKLVIAGYLHPYLSSERAAVAPLLRHLPKNSLITFDRGYPCYWMFYLLQAHSQCKFVMRVSTGFNKEVKQFVQSPQTDAILHLQPGYEAMKTLQEAGYPVTKETTVALRFVKVILSTGETEVLATNLTDPACYTAEDLKQVYHLRWGVETFYGIAKKRVTDRIFQWDKAPLHFVGFLRHFVCVQLVKPYRKAKYSLSGSGKQASQACV